MLTLILFICAVMPLHATRYSFQAPLCKVSLNTKTISAYQPLITAEKDTCFQAAGAVYNKQHAAGIARDIAAVFKQKAYVNSRWGIVHVSPQEKAIQDSALYDVRYTGCSHTVPHWQLSARKAYVTNGMLIANGVRAQVGQTTVGWIPFVFVPLQKKPPLSCSLPRFSYDREYGLGWQQEVTLRAHSDLAYSYAHMWRRDRGLILRHAVLYEHKKLGGGQCAYYYQADNDQRDMLSTGKLSYGNADSAIVLRGSWCYGSDSQIQANKFSQTYEYDQCHDIRFQASYYDAADQYYVTVSLEKEKYQRRLYNKADKRYSQVFPEVMVACNEYVVSSPYATVAVSGFLYGCSSSQANTIVRATPAVVADMHGIWGACSAFFHTPIECRFNDDSSLCTAYCIGQMKYDGPLFWSGILQPYLYCSYEREYRFSDGIAREDMLRARFSHGISGGWLSGGGNYYAYGVAYWPQINEISGNISTDTTYGSMVIEYCYNATYNFLDTGTASIHKKFCWQSGHEVAVSLRTVYAHKSGTAYHNYLTAGGVYLEGDCATALQLSSHEKLEFALTSQWGNMHDTRSRGLLSYGAKVTYHGHCYRFSIGFGSSVYDIKERTKNEGKWYLSFSLMELGTAQMSVGSRLS